MTDEELKALVASNAQAISGLAERQNSFQSSLEEIQQIIQKTAERQADFYSSLEEIKKLIQSNARAIEAESTEARSHRQAMSQAIRDLMARNFENLSQHQDFRDAMATFTERLDRGQGAA